MARRGRRGGFVDRDADLDDVYRREDLTRLRQQVEALTRSVATLLEQRSPAKTSQNGSYIDDENPFASDHIN